MVNQTAITSQATDFANIALSQFSFAEFLSTIKPLAVFVLGMVIYSVFIFKFYRFLSRRDIIKLKLDKYAKGVGGFVENFLISIFYIIKNIFLTPLMIFFWFLILTSLLLVLTKTHTPTTIIMTAGAIVATVRITSYYTEDLSQDLAKMIPFALLGVFLIDISFFSIDGAIGTARQLPLLWKPFLYYLGFIIVLELVLRILSTLFRFASPEKKEK